MAKYFVASHALIRRDGKYLTTRRAPLNDYMPEKWDLPGGTVEDGESLEKALEREVAEETGLIIKIIQPFFVFNTNNPDRPTLQIIYRCEYVSGEVKLDPLEHDDFSWLDIANLKKLDAIPFLQALLLQESI